MEKKNQHYVPQFHLRQWSFDEKRISLYNKHNKVFVDSKASIKNIASKDYLYGKTPHIEDFLGQIEIKASLLYKKLMSNNSINCLTEEEQAFVCLHLTICNERSLQGIDDKENLIKTYNQMKKSNLNLNNKEETDYAFQAAFSSLDTAIAFYPILWDLKLGLIKNDTEVEFITSDYPTIKYNPWSVKRNLLSGWGMSSLGLMLIMPISPRLAIIAYDDMLYTMKDENFGLISINKKNQINEINKLMIINSQDNIFFTSNTPIQYLKNLIKRIPHPISVEYGTSSLSKTILFYQTARISYQANFSFFDIIKGAMEIPVPNNAKGLLRPASEELFERAMREWERN